MTNTLLPLAAGAILTLAAAAFALYVWTWARHVARLTGRRRSGCPQHRIAVA